MSSSCQMKSDLRVVTGIPLAEIWDEQGEVIAGRIRQLGQEEIRQLLQTGQTQFVVANAGDPLRRIPMHDSYSFWKLEVRKHLVAEPDRTFNVYEFHEGYCYLASEWRDANGQTIVLLEKYH
jgi:hypothetical protein